MQENFPRSRYNLEFHILSFTTLAEIQTYRKITRRATNYAYSGRYRRINSVPLLNRALGKTTWFARATSRLSEPPSTLNIRFNARALMGSVPNPCVILPLWAIYKYVPNLGCARHQTGIQPLWPTVMSCGVRFDLALFAVYQTLCLSRTTSLCDSESRA